MSTTTRIGIGLLAWLLTFVASAQIRVDVFTTLPVTGAAPAGADTSLYMAGTFNNWNPGDTAFRLRRQATGHYVISLPDTLTRFAYKFTRGSWALTEGTANGSARPNRQFDRATATDPRRIRAQIAGWERLPGYRFIVTEVPANTPHDASLYITGNFANWNPGNPAYRLTRQADGHYYVTVFTDLDKLEYKFTRGNWASVEGRENGKARPNRVLHRRDVVNDQPVTANIQSWEDLSGTFDFYSLYDLLMLFACFQGLLLLVAVPTIQNYNRRANRWLVALLGVQAMLMGVRIISSYRDVAQTYTKLLLVPDFILFLYAPIFYLYIRKLLYGARLRPAAEQPGDRWWYHFIPAAIQLLVYLPYFLMEDKAFQLKIVNRAWDIQTLFLGTGFVALLYNAGYWWLCRRTIGAYRAQYQTSYSYEQSLHYFNTVLGIQAVCLVLWAFMFVLAGFGWLTDTDVVAIAERNVDAIWLVFSTITYFLGYSAIHQPEIFKLPDQPLGLFNEVPPAAVAEPTPPERDPAFEPLARTEPTVPVVTPVAESALASRLPVHPAPSANADAETPDELRELVGRIQGFMKQHKPYINPNLTIHELAFMLKMPPHVLSRAINDGFGKNFFDLINSYRVEELKQRLNDPRYRSYTLLSLAFEVGFNSKTAFNRAFKKITNQTPSQYFHYVRQ